MKLRSDAEKISFKTVENKFGNKLFKNRLYNFSRHPLSKNRSMTSYLTEKMNNCVIKVKLERLTDEDIAAAQRRLKDNELQNNKNENRMLTRSSRKKLLALAENMTISTIKREPTTTHQHENRRSTRNRPCLPIMGNEKKTLRVQLKRLNSNDIKAIKKKLSLDLGITAYLLKNCTPVTVVLKRIKTEAVKVTKRVTVKLTSIVNKYYPPNSWLTPYYR